MNRLQIFVGIDSKDIDKLFLYIVVCKNRVIEICVFIYWIVKNTMKVYATLLVPITFLCLLTPILSKVRHVDVKRTCDKYTEYFDVTLLQCVHHVCMRVSVETHFIRSIMLG